MGRKGGKRNEKKNFENPFKPGAGHMPPYLAGRDEETNQFKRLLNQSTILENMVLTGLRGVGKTVLLETFKPIATQNDWVWVGSDMSESASINEESLAKRIITDLSVFTSGMSLTTSRPGLGFGATAKEEIINFSYDLLSQAFSSTPGLISDKLKYVLEFVWGAFKGTNKKGCVFAYDEAQNLSDQEKKQQFPLAMLLDVFQSIQRKEIPFMLALTGLPTLFPKLVEARTYAERMFRVITLTRLNKRDSRDAILKPIEDSRCPVQLDNESVKIIIQYSDGYPYFIQFICREVYDSFLQKIAANQKNIVPMSEIQRKLDTDFFAGRWARATDRQRDLLYVIASLENCSSEFTVQEVVAASKTEVTKSFSSSHVNQILSSLSNSGLVYKNRYGKYSLAVPLFEDFIRRTYEPTSQ